MALVSEDNGFVNIDNEVYFTTSTITEDYVYTIAKLDKNDFIISDCFQIETCNYKSQSLKLKQRFLEIFPEEKSSLDIRKDEKGIPRLFQDNKQLNYSFSLTHNGLFCGLAF